MIPISPILFVLFSGLQIADGLTTIKVLLRPDREEGEKVARWLMGRVGVWMAMIILSVLNIGLVGGFLYVSGLYQAEAIAQIAVSLFCVQRLWVVRNNVKNI
jgi:hypothetical protein